jgi:predicted DNA-binding transcriptional regulator AlpA
LNTTREYLTASELACHLRVSKRTVFRWVKAGLLPEPLRPTCRKSLWRVAEVRQRLDAVARQRQAC